MTFLDIANLVWRSSSDWDQKIDLRKDIFPAISGYFSASPIHTEEHEKSRVSKCVIIGERDAIRQFRNWDCHVTVARLFYPFSSSDFLRSSFYVQLDDLYDQNPSLTPESVKHDLERILKHVVDANVIREKEMPSISIYFKSHAWYAFINFSEELTDDQIAFVFTWLTRNTFDLPSIDKNDRISMRYAKKSQKSQ